MRIQVLLIFMTIFPLESVTSQTYIGRIGSGVGSYNMKEMSEYVNFAKIFIPVDVKTFNDFPPYLNYHLALRKHGKNEQDYFEIEYAFYSTGSRLNYQDYSGEYNLDVKLNAFSFALKYGTFFHQGKHLKLGLYQQLSSYFTKIKFIEEINVYGESGTSKSSAGTKHLGLEAGAMGVYPFSNKMGLFTSLGYYQQMYTFRKGKYVPDWSGIRFELGLLFDI
ncbi:MAG: hypothetical protein K9G58_05060 [Bacteroidales bacterium]|nr:hypothetical protein [Bacteroidales bacterium]MCF8386263.1 hypothetical protein [Bacteroidales bacterium]MCF8397516.1 hypothetical protein [Bacteroidales bacterium]